MAQSKQQNTSPKIDPKGTEIYELPHKEFKIIILEKLDILKENTYRQLNEIRKIMHGQNENSNKKIETIKKI